jgi:hypothetical protein
MDLRADADGFTARLSGASLHVGERRIPRERITSVELGRNGMLVLGDGEVLADLRFAASERAAFVAIERALAPGNKAITLFLEESSYRPGEVVRGHVDLRWPRAAPVRGVRVGLIGAESTKITTSNGKTTSTRREYRPLIAEEIDVFGGPPVRWTRAAGDVLRRLAGRLDYPILAAGRHRFAFEFRLPEGALPSFTGTHAEVGYQVYARVDIPLRFDLCFEGVLPVGLPEGARLSRLKGRVDREGGFLKADVDMKIDIEPCLLEPGERLRGRVRVRNHSTKRIRGATLRLLALEFARAGGRERDTIHELNTGYLPAPDPAAPSQDVTFEIPVSGPFPYVGRHSSLSYVLEARLDTPLGRDTIVRIPLETG